MLRLKNLLKRGALVAAANWPAVAIQFVAGATLKALLAVPIIGAGVLVAVLLGADVATLLQGSLRDMFTTIAATLMSEPIALMAFVVSFGVALVGGSVLMFLVKGGTVDVLVAAHRTTGSIELEPIALDTVRAAARFSVARFIHGCRRLFRPYLALGLILMTIYAVSGAGYLAFIVYGYQAAATDRVLFLVGWTFVAAFSAGALVGWITIVNLLYLLMQIAIAVDGVGLSEAATRVARFIREEFRQLAGVVGIVVALLIAATLVSALAWSGVGLIAFVPIVGLAVLPLQLVALLVRGLAFEYLGLTALTTYVSLYVDYRVRTSRTADLAARPAVAGPLERPA